MVAVQALLMKYFMIGLHSNLNNTNAVLNDSPTTCTSGCKSCSSVNGCLRCEPKYALYIKRNGFKQFGICVKNCPNGFFRTHLENKAFCDKCTVAGCAICKSKSMCGVCDKKKVIYAGVCRTKCPINTKYKSRTNQCITYENNKKDLKTSKRNKNEVFSREKLKIFYKKSYRKILFLQKRQRKLMKHIKLLIRKKKRLIKKYNSKQKRSLQKEIRRQRKYLKTQRNERKKFKLLKLKIDKMMKKL